MYYVLTTNILKGTLIKPSFPQPGLKHPSRAKVTADEIAEATATVLVRSLPVGVAGVVFLSGKLIIYNFMCFTLHRSLKWSVNANLHTGGLPDDTASLYLSRLNALRDKALEALHSPSNSSINPHYRSFSRLPPLTFSFGRGLQGGAMRRWVAGDDAGACSVFAERAKVCYEAAGGKA